MKYTIFDEKALYDAFPQFFEEVTKTIVNRRKVSHALKAGLTIPGVILAEDIREEESRIQEIPVKQVARL